jgi:hypothetical protein
MWYYRQYVGRHSGEIGVLSVSLLLLSPPVSYVWYPKCTANLRWVGVVIIESEINFPPVLGWFRRLIEIEPRHGQ